MISACERSACRQWNALDIVSRLLAPVAGFVVRVALLGALASLVGCGKAAKPQAKSPPPAQVDHHIDEAHLNTITLTEKAEERLGIRLAEVGISNLRRKRTWGGEVVLPAGQSIMVSAPIAGTLSEPSEISLPVPGRRIDAGQLLFRLTPLLTPERDVLTPAEQVAVARSKIDLAALQVEAERRIESAQITIDAAQIAYERAQTLLKNKAGSQRVVDEAMANLELAREALVTAQARFELLKDVRLDEHAGKQEVHTIASPITGVLVSLDAAVGETVSAGDPLFQVIRTTPLWVRVPVYVGHWAEIDATQPAQVAEYGGPPAATRAALPIAAPPMANANAATVDVYFALDNADGSLYPGQKLAVTVSLNQRADQLIVPLNSVLYDVHGGSWVYEQIKSRVYARRRIAIDFVDGNSAVVRSGLDPGAKLVTDGAAELFGTEFGVGH